MTDAMTHRGPDGHGYWASSDQRVALGHRRLAIIDLSEKGKQPMSNEDGTVWVTFNGEIYNFVELRSELRAQGHVFRSGSDTECLVHLYEEYGAAMLGKLDGDFAFAIWDDKEKSLFLARDPLGVKPLYYGHVDGQFVFASELKAILAHPRLQRQLDDAAVYHYLTYLAVPAPQSMVKGISKLRAGFSLIVNLDGDIRLHQYWEPLPRTTAIKPSEYDEKLSELFTRSVSKRLVSDVPVGLLFSGGVDSTLNALAFKNLSAGRTVRGFTAGMAAARYTDEADFAGSVAKDVGLDWYLSRLTEKDLRNLMGPDGDLIARQDEPLADPVCVPLHLVTKLAREHGTTVLQAGEGADETFCGYDGYRNWIRRYHRMWKPLTIFPKFFSQAGYLMMRNTSSPQWGKIADVLLRRARGQELFVSEAVGFYENEKRSILQPDFCFGRHALDSFDLVKPHYNRVRQAFPDATILQIMTYIELSIRLPDLLLMRADKISMSNSIELRVPFLDRELVEFSLAVPDGYKLRDGVSKEPYKRLGATMMQACLRSSGGNTDPDYARSIFYRAKTGFGAPIQDWFDGGLGDDMRELMTDHRVGLEQYFSVSAIRKILDAGMVTVNRSFQMWVLYSFMCWKRHFKF